MSNTIKNSGNKYETEINEFLNSRNEIEQILKLCIDDIASGDSTYISKLLELNDEISDYYSRGFSDFLDEMSAMFTDYSDQFEDLDEQIKARI